MNVIRVVLGDITDQKVDAIVNAANTKLLGGGGVDGAIHRAAGPELLEECISLNGCQTGHSKVTKAYKLPAKWIIHTVGPVWAGGNAQEDQKLAECYRNSLKCALERNCGSIAFPSISTGAYRFPLKRAANIAIHEISSFLKLEDVQLQVIIVCYNNDSFIAYNDALKDENACQTPGGY